MKGMVYTVFLLLVPILAMGQQYQMLPNFYRPLDPSAVEQSGQSETTDKVDFNMTVGTGFSSFAGHSTLRSYLAPSVEYQVNPNLNLRFTTIFSNTNALSPGMAASASQTGKGMPLNQGNNSFAFSGEGIYQPNDKFYIRAGGQYADRSMQPFSLYPQSNQVNSDCKSFHLGMGYKISESSSISFRMQLSDGYNPYANPYNQMNSPFSPHNRFNRGYHTYPW